RAPAGCALFVLNWRAVLRRPGLLPADLFVRERRRGRGIGESLLTKLARIARGRGCGRLEWAVLDWSAPSIAFYRSLGAVSLDDWMIMRLTGDALAALTPHL